ncbi:MAG TPA: hypothetical protein VGL61_31390 [Kofleriaceae bacterium]
MIDRRMLARELLTALAEDKELASEARHVLGIHSDGGAQLETVAERARRTRIGSSTIRRAIAEKRLVVVRIGRSVRVPVNAEIAPRTLDETLMRAEHKLGLADRGRR